MQPVGQQQQTVRVDSLSPNNRKRYEYFLTEAARQHAAGNYSAAFDLYEHARNIDPNSATANYYLSLYLTEMKQDSLGLLRLQKAIEQDPENLILQSDSPNTISARKIRGCHQCLRGCLCQEPQQYRCAPRVGAALSAAEELQDDAQYRQPSGDRRR